jgi:PIN domain nuclease of toxin-antitoxin system
MLGLEPLPLHHNVHHDVHHHVRHRVHHRDPLERVLVAPASRKCCRSSRATELFEKYPVKQGLVNPHVLPIMNAI